MSRPTLLALNQYTLVPILSEWMVDAEVCALDTAVCNRSARDKLLQDLSKCNVEIVHGHYNEDCLAWQILRNVGMKIFRLQFIYCPSQNTMILGMLKVMLERTKILSVLSFEYDWWTDSLPLLDVITSVKEIRVHYWHDCLQMFLSRVSFSSLVITHKNVEKNCLVPMSALLGSLTTLSVRGTTNLSGLLLNHSLCYLKCGLSRILSSTYSPCECEFRRVSFTDASTVEIGGVQFVLTDLSLDSYLDETGCNCLIRMIDHVRSISVLNFRKTQMPLTLLMRKCSLLHSIYFKKIRIGDPGIEPDDIIQLVQRSPDLKSFEAYESIHGDVSALLEFIARNCKNLNNFGISCHIERHTAFDELVRSCGKSSIYALLHRVGLRSLIACTREADIISITTRIDYCKRTLHPSTTIELPSYSILSSDWIQLFSQNPSLKQITIENGCTFNNAMCEQMVHLCPLLTTITIRH